jgi:hypothetical protein
MRPLLSTVVFAALVLGCSPPGPESPSVMTFPHEAVHIDGVCSGVPSSHPAPLAVKVEAPFENGQRRFRIVNASGATHEVRAKFVVSNSGPCDRGFVRSHRRELQDTRTCEHPQATTLGPDQSLEMRLLPERQRLAGACNLVGLALHADVDGQPTCVELGAWVAYQPGAGSDD